jgi:hypothetical protein
MIYGEEFQSFDVSKGLYLDVEDAVVPVGYCPALINLQIDATGALVSRPNFATLENTTAISETNLNYTASSSQVPEWELSRYHKVFDLAPQTSAGVAFLYTRELDATNVEVRKWTEAGSVSTSNVAKANSPIALAQYRDKYYVLNQAGTTINEWDLSTTFTSQITGLTRPCTQLVAHRDRLFAFSTNSIYYTELATSGGYPSNWNTGLNLINMPSVGTRIYRVFVQNDRIYIFTNNGLFQLYATGTPTNWDIQLINKNIKIYNENAVDFINGIFIYTDGSDVFALNGAQPKSIAQPIKYLFEAGGPSIYKTDYTRVTAQSNASYRIYGYQDGFILAATFLVPVSSNWRRAGTDEQYSLYFYFDGTRWSQFTFSNNNGTPADVHSGLIGVLRRKALSAPLNTTDILLEMRSMGGSPETYRVFVWKVLKQSGFSTGGYAFNPTYNWLVATSLKDLSLNIPKINRLKYGTSKYKSTMGTLTGRLYGDDRAVLCNQSFANTASKNVITRFPLSAERANTLQMVMLGTYIQDTGGVNQSTFTYPSVRFFNMGFFCNTDTRTIPNGAYSL